VGYTREQKKWAAFRRAELNLGIAFKRIDFFEDVIKPELEELAAGTKKVDTFKTPELKPCN
jgi:hypothetical protein